MSATVRSSRDDRHAVYNKTRLFLVSSLALCTAGIANAIRANTASDLQRTFLDPIDKAHSAEMIASVLGVPVPGIRDHHCDRQPFAGCNRDGIPASTGGHPDVAREC